MLDRTAGDILNSLDGDDVLGRAFRELDVSNDRDWAWDNYENVVRGLARILHAHRLLEVGGGRDPLFKADELKALGIEMTVNDISQTELDVLPDRPTARPVSTWPATFRRWRICAAISIWRFRAWCSNMSRTVSGPGRISIDIAGAGRGRACIHSDALCVSVRREPAVARRCRRENREADLSAIAPTTRIRCFRHAIAGPIASERKMKPMLQGIGYREVAILPFYGHGYFDRVPVVRDIHARFTALARKHDWRTVASYAYIAARK